MSGTKFSCQGCRHYYTTWDPDLPRGCRKFGFKSQTLPSILVKRETGNECLAYEARPKKKETKKDLDLNDPKNW